MAHFEEGDGGGASLSTQGDTFAHLGALHVVTAVVLLDRGHALGAGLGVGHQPQAIGRQLRLTVCAGHWVQDRQLNYCYVDITGT